MKDARSNLHSSNYQGQEPDYPANRQNPLQAAPRPKSQFSNDRSEDFIVSDERLKEAYIKNEEKVIKMIKENSIKPLHKESQPFNSVNLPAEEKADQTLQEQPGVQTPSNRARNQRPREFTFHKRGASHDFNKSSLQKDEVRLSEVNLSRDLDDPDKSDYETLQDLHSHSKAAKPAGSRLGN